MTDLIFKTAPEVDLVDHQGSDASVVAAARVSVAGSRATTDVDASQHATTPRRWPLTTIRRCLMPDARGASCGKSEGDGCWALHDKYAALPSSEPPATGENGGRS